MTGGLVGFVWRSLRATLRSDRLTHGLTVSTICVSLALVGAVWLAQRNLTVWAQRWAGERTLAVFVASGSTEEARARIEKILRQKVGLVDVRWTAPEAAANELARLLGIAGGHGLDEFAPWIAEGRRSEASRDADLADLAMLPDVLHVDTGTIVAERIEAAARALRAAGAAVTTLLLLGTFLVVANTIGLALNARRDEVEIMDLVGTPIHWIFAAYVTEGVFLGCLGAGIALGMVEAALHWGTRAWADLAALPTLGGFRWPEAVGLLAIGGGIGAVAAAVSIERFLRTRAG